MNNIVIYQSENGYFTKITDHGKFKLTTEKSELDLPYNLPFTFTETPIKIVKEESNSVFKGYDYNGVFYNEIEYKELQFKLNIKESLISNLEEWVGTGEEFLSQYKFYKSTKLIYDKEIVETEYPFLIAFSNGNEKFIEPVLKFKSEDDQLYLVIFKPIDIIHDVASKFNFNFRKLSMFGNIQEINEYSCHNDGDYLQFKCGYCSNTHLDKERISYSKFPTTLENCKKEIERWENLIEKEFIVAKNKMTPQPIGILNISEILSKSENILQSVYDMSYNKTNRQHYDKAVKNIKEINETILNYLKENEFTNN